MPNREQIRDHIEGLLPVSQTGGSPLLSPREGRKSEECHPGSRERTSAEARSGPAGAAAPSPSPPSSSSASASSSSSSSRSSPFSLSAFFLTALLPPTFDPELLRAAAAAFSSSAICISTSAASARSSSDVIAPFSLPLSPPSPAKMLPPRAS